MLKIIIMEIILHLILSILGLMGGDKLDEVFQTSKTRTNFDNGLAIGHNISLGEFDQTISE